MEKLEFQINNWRNGEFFTFKKFQSFFGKRVQIPLIKPGNNMCIKVDDNSNPSTSPYEQ